MLLFSFNGIRWGRVECWNRDEMALKGWHGKPRSYLKPPGVVFLNQVVVLSSVERVEKLVKYLTGKREHYNEAKLLGSRFLVVALYAGTVVLAFQISLTYYGVFAARFIALVFATSAGFVEYNHFLSCDSPLLFWMMLAFYFAMRITLTGRWIDYLMACFITGVATNMKYNGLAVGFALVVAHVLLSWNRSWKDRVFSSHLIAGLAMVPVGFIVTDPYVLWDYKKFVSDFMYNYAVTPVYDGQLKGYGYTRFLADFPEILGWPGTVLIAAAILASLAQIAWRPSFSEHRERSGFLLAASVFALYFIKIGSFPRMETRFVLPSIPFAVLSAGPFLQSAARRARWFYILAVPVLLYNCVCSFVVGMRFNDDPRIEAQDWMEANARGARRIESSAGSPHWYKLHALDGLEELEVQHLDWSKPIVEETVDLRMPHDNGRAKLFEKVFKANKWVSGQAASQEGVCDERLFCRTELLRRNPDIITIHSSDYLVPSAIVHAYYLDLIHGEFPYEVVYDRESKPANRWLYPLDIDFLWGREVLLVRK